MYRKNFPVRKEQRQKEAKERQAAYDALSLEKKLERLDRAGLSAQRARYRIARKLQAASTEAPKLKKK